MTRDTIHAPPPTEPDTGRVPRDTAEDVRAYLAALAERDRIELQIHHLRGRVEGLDVDVAQSQAFEVRTARALQSISDQVGELKTMLQEYANTRMADLQKIVVLEQRQRQQSVACERRHEREAL